MFHVSASSDENGYDPSSMSEMDRDYALNYGREHLNMAWITTPLDQVLPNPFYDGEPVPHPLHDPED